MQINLNRDESLINEALELTNLSTHEELVKLALTELVRGRAQEESPRPRRSNSIYPNPWIIYSEPF